MVDGHVNRIVNDCWYGEVFYEEIFLEGVSSVGGKKQNVKDVFIQDSTDMTLQICM